MTTTTCRPTCAARRINDAECVCDLVVAHDRAEHEPCERGTVGCSINHSNAPALGCETW